MPPDPPCLLQWGGADAVVGKDAGMQFVTSLSWSRRHWPGLGMGRTLHPTCDSSPFWGWGRLLAVPSRMKSWHEVLGMGTGNSGHLVYPQASAGQARSTLLLSPGSEKSPAMTLGRSDTSGLFFCEFPSPPS